MLAGGGLGAKKRKNAPKGAMGWMVGRRKRGGIDFFRIFGIEYGT